MANNPTNHLPSFNEWFNEMIEDLDRAAKNLYARAHSEFLPKVAFCASHDLDEDTVKWTDIVNGVIKGLQSYGKNDLAKDLAKGLHNAVANPEQFLADRAAMWTLEDEMAAIYADMDAEDDLS